METFKHPFLAAHEMPLPKTQPVHDTPKKETSLHEIKMPLKPFDAQYSANRFPNHPAVRQNQELHAKQKIEDQRLGFVKLFKSLDIDEITTFLNNPETEPEFQKEIEKTKIEYAEQLSSATFLDNKDWKILTGIKLSGKEKIEHALGTYLTAREMIENDLPELAMEIKNEGVTLEQFYRACLFHDIGKLEISEFILNNKLSDEDWVTGFMGLPVTIDDVSQEVHDGFKDEKEQQAYANKNCQDDILASRGLTPPDSIRNDPRAMKDYFEEKRIRAVDFVPIREMLTDEQAMELKKNGINLQLPLKTIIQLHEKKSEEILTILGFANEAFLAGNHHNYRARNRRLGEKPVSLSMLRIATIIHLADIRHAMSGDRSYHQKQPTLKILAILVDDAENEITDSNLTARCIKITLAKMSPAYLDEVRGMSNTKQTPEYRKNRRNELATIERFLEDNPRKETYSLKDSGTYEEDNLRLAA